MTSAYPADRERNVCCPSAPLREDHFQRVETFRDVKAARQETNQNYVAYHHLPRSTRQSTEEWDAETELSESPFCCCCFFAHESLVSYEDDDCDSDMTLRYVTHVQNDRPGARSHAKPPDREIRFVRISSGGRLLVWGMAADLAVRTSRS